MNIEGTERNTKLLFLEINGKARSVPDFLFTNQDSLEISNLDFKGKVTVMEFFFASCPTICPVMNTNMRILDDEFHERDDFAIASFTIDPENDTPEKLKQFAVDNYVDGEQWTFLQGTESNVREFANVLAVKYKQISPLDFSHSNIISVFNPGGELVHQQEGLGVDNKETIAKIIETVNQ